MTQPQDKMRAEFEAHIKANYKPEDGWWCRQIDDGGYSSGKADEAWKIWQAACAQQSAQSQQDALDAHCYVIDVSSSGLRKTIRIDRMHIDHAINPDHLIGRSIRQAIEDIDAAIATQGASNV